MAVEYFGNCETSGSPPTIAGGFNPVGYNAEFEVWTQAVTCPGSGDQIIRQMSVSARESGSVGSQVRLGIYTAAGSLVYDFGSVATPTIDSAWPTFAWESVGDGATSNLGTLTGGSSYKLLCVVVPASGSYPSIAYASGSSTGNYYDDSLGITGGLPSTLPAGHSQGDSLFVLRVGVESSGGGSSPIPVFMHHYLQH